MIAQEACWRNREYGGRHTCSWEQRKPLQHQHRLVRTPAVCWLQPSVASLPTACVTFGAQYNPRCFLHGRRIKPDLSHTKGVKIAINKSLKCLSYYLIFHRKSCKNKKVLTVALQLRHWQSETNGGP